ncbi:hypothetical protein AAF712_008291 [Marasmius tenuissimus]|uniref:Uncharacterized protein n=1 Tax=Marasmius tenuissimus TaxID=585030 RepID=A0ABR2ZUD6_9AGAR
MSIGFHNQSLDYRNFYYIHLCDVNVNLFLKYIDLAHIHTSTSASSSRHSDFYYCRLSEYLHPPSQSFESNRRRDSDLRVCVITLGIVYPESLVVTYKCAHSDLGVDPANAESEPDAGATLDSARCFKYRSGRG